MFFGSWTGIGHVVLSTAITFVAIVLLLRTAGQQALAKMSGYDLVVTVTFGSIVATVILSREVTIADGIAGLVTLLVLQKITRWFQSRWLPVHHLVREAPHVVLWDGTLLQERLLASSTSADEVRAAVRRAGCSSLGEVQIVVLENDGDWSIVRRSEKRTDNSAFFGLAIPDRDSGGETAAAKAPTRASPRRIP
jgi:uncharacterized membrane protein YcaP (DUF421 family)